MSDKKLGEREPRTLHDPRRDPTDPPPPGDDSQAAKDERSRDRAKDSDDDPPSSRRRPEPPQPSAPSETGSVVTSVDPRIAELEPLVAAADWEGVAKVLGTPEAAGRLPPNLGLVYALARKETGVAKEEHYEPNGAAIQCMAGLFGIPKESPIALVLGKRLLRSNPVAWQKAPAPPTHISLFIVALGLLLGAGIGWLLSFGYVTFRLPSLPF
jgi:hypothetical protein